MMGGPNMPGPRSRSPCAREAALREVGVELHRQPEASCQVDAVHERLDQAIEAPGPGRRRCSLRADRQAGRAEPAGRRRRR